MQSRVGQQPLDLKEARQVETEKNDDRSGDAREQRFVLREDLADFRRDSTLQTPRALLCPSSLQRATRVPALSTLA